jgi:hypothetical protein
MKEIGVVEIPLSDSEIDFLCFQGSAPFLALLAAAAGLQA